MNDGGQGVFGQVDHAVADSPPQAARHVARPLLFLRSWLAHPLRMGSVIPSSDALCRRVVRRAWPAPGRAVLELGSGTGGKEMAELPPLDANLRLPPAS